MACATHVHVHTTFLYIACAPLDPRVHVHMLLNVTMVDASAIGLSSERIAANVNACAPNNRHHDVPAALLTSASRFLLRLPPAPAPDPPPDEPPDAAEAPAPC